MSEDKAVWDTRDEKHRYKVTILMESEELETIQDVLDRFKETFDEWEEANPIRIEVERLKEAEED